MHRSKKYESFHRHLDAAREVLFNLDFREYGEGTFHSRENFALSVTADERDSWNPIGGWTARITIDKYSVVQAWVEHPCPTKALLALREKHNALQSALATLANLSLTPR